MRVDEFLPYGSCNKFGKREGFAVDHFKLVAPYTPTGDQPEAIAKLTEGVEAGLKEQVLLGVTGSGKTFTMANVIANVNRPTLVLAHNKTLAAQLCSEFREFFPDNAVEFFISYYDYYQPEAYIAASDTYIEKDSSINDEIDRLRHSATAALFERRDVIIVSSVSCIYGLGDPEDYTNLMLSLRPGMHMEIRQAAAKLVSMNYTSDNSDFSSRGVFRINGDTLSIRPADRNDTIIRVEFFGDEIDPGSRNVTPLITRRGPFCLMRQSSRPLTMRRRTRKWNALSTAFWLRWKNACSILRIRESFWKRTAWSSARGTTWSFYGKRSSAAA